MATIIRSTRVSEHSITLGIPATGAHQNVATPRQLTPHQSEVKHSVSAESKVESGIGMQILASNTSSNIAVEHAKQHDEEIKILKARLKNAEEALHSEKSRIEELMEQWKAKAHAEGMAAGWEEGLRKGMESLEKEAKLIAKITDSMSLMKQSVLEAAEDKIVEIVMEAICKMIGQSFVEKASIKTIVNTAINRVKGVNAERIRLSPYDHQIISGLSTSIPMVNGKTIEFIADDSIVIGGCVIESETGSLDCRLDSQLIQLKEVLLTARHLPEISEQENSPGQG